MDKTVDTLPEIEPATARLIDRNRHLPLGAPLAWLAAGWRDLWNKPGPSLAYGLGIALLSAGLVWALFAFDWAQVLFPALSGFLVAAPVLATGLYEKSRRIAAGEPVTLGAMLMPRRGGGMHLFFVGVILLMLMLIWMRAAVLLYALFFGYRAFPGFDHITPMLLGTPQGLWMLVVGTAVGGLFAAFAFAIGAFSIPMMLDRKLDAFSAMGLSMSLVWDNLPAALVWAALVMILTVFSLATAFVGLVVIFPWLGHATWHAYMAVRD